MSTTDIYSVIQGCPCDPAKQDYYDRMVHSLPDGPLVQREKWILEKVTGRDVVHLGGWSGKLDAKVRAVARSVVTVDREGDCQIVDLDKDVLPKWRADVFLLADVLEHLSNPGRLLDHLRQCGGELVVTVPGCNTKGHYMWTVDGKENVNPDHVAWYSPKVLETLLRRSGWNICEFAWHYRDKVFQEGISVVAR